MSSRWPNPDPGARGLRNQGQRASTYRNPEGGRGTRHWGSAHWGPFLFTEHASQALPWSGDRSQLGCTGWDAGSPVSRALGPASPGLGPALFAGSLGITHQNTTSAGGANLWSFAPAAASSTRWDCSIGCNLATSWGGPEGSYYPTTWDVELPTNRTTSSKDYQSSDSTTSSEPSQQSDRATLARYPKTNHGGERSARLRRKLSRRLMRRGLRA